jgi:hypothetical protein
MVAGNGESMPTRAGVRTLYYIDPGAVLLQKIEIYGSEVG